MLTGFKVIPFEVRIETAVHQLPTPDLDYRRFTLYIYVMCLITL